MKCPACGKEMVEENFGVNVDVCKNGCKGIWFDQHELAMLDENNEGLGRALEEALMSPRVNDENRPQLNCPKCNIPMRPHTYKRAKEVNVDECYKCGGFFLDSGELKEVRDNFMSDEEMDAYLQQILSEVPEYEEAKAEMAQEKERIEAINHYTRFLRANYWRKKFKGGEGEPAQ